MTDVFVSYARSDGDKPLMINRKLQELGLSTFLDTSNIKAGEVWPERLKREVLRAKVVIGCLSPRSTQRRWVIEECLLASKNNKLLPLIIDECDRKLLPPEITMLQEVDLIDFDGREPHSGWTEVVDFLARRLKRNLTTVSEAMLRRALPTMIEIPSGSFLMGSPETEAGRRIDEGLPRETDIGHRFEISRCPVTVSQWEALMAPEDWNGTRLATSHGLPITNISQGAAKDFIARLNQLSGAAKPNRPPSEYRFRLPCEKEWEFACRAGSQDRFCCGESETQLRSFAWFSENAESLKPVGTRRPNDFGICDMHGLVWEWTSDQWYSQDEEAKKRRRNMSAIDAFEPQRGVERKMVCRGGSWQSDASAVRSAARLSFKASEGRADIGFRIARTLPPKSRGRPDKHS